MSATIQQTPYGKLIAQWVHCTKCPLSQTRKNVVFARGKLPCDVLFLGEGPGDSEDVRGLPFDGPAGSLLDKMIEEALQDVVRNNNTPLRLGFFNLVGCIPKDDDNHKKGEPTTQEVEACGPRLDTFLTIAKPKLLVCTGKLAENRAKVKSWHKTYAILNILHPAAIIKNKDNQGILIQRTTVQIADAFNEHFPP